MHKHENKKMISSLLDFMKKLVELSLLVIRAITAIRAIAR